MINKEERNLVMKFIHLTLLRKVLEHDMEKIKNADLKFKEPYLLLLEKTTNKVGIDLGKVKKDMFKQGISVYNLGQEDQVCKYLIACRGYRENMNLIPHLMKNTVLEYMEMYLC
jgi:hypothetical protein